MESIVQEGRAGERPLQPANAAVLPQLIPALVHRLNNSLLVVRGALDVALELGHYDEPTLVRALHETQRLTDALAILGQFSRLQVDQPEAVDLRALSESAELLLGPLAHAEKLDFARVERSADVIVRAPLLALQRVVIALCAKLLLFRAEEEVEGEAPQQRSRLSTTSSVRSSDRRATVTFVRSGSLSSADLLELAQACELEQAGVNFSYRVLGAATAIRFSLPALAEEPVLPPAASGASILLVVELGGMGELVRQVLTEGGHGVEVLSFSELRDSLSEELDLLLFDGDCDEGAALASTLAARAASRPRFAALGCLPEEGLCPELEKPFRPGELLQFVAQVLGS